MKQKTNKAPRFTAKEFLKGKQVDVSKIEAANLGKLLDACVAAKGISLVQAAEVACYMYDQVSSKRGSIAKVMINMIKKYGVPEDVSRKARYNALLSAPHFAVRSNLVEYFMEV